MLGIAFIVWTIYVTIGSDVGEDEDQSLLSTYHKVDDQFNKIQKSNKLLNENYDIKFIFNDTIIDGVDTNDIFYSQRVIKNRETRKTILNIGSNEFKVIVQTKDGKKVKNYETDIVVTKTTNHLYDKILKLKDDKIGKFDIKNKGSWNITGKIKIENITGSFMIKTDAK